MQTEQFCTGVTIHTGGKQCSILDPNKGYAMRLTFADIAHDVENSNFKPLAIMQVI